MANKPGKRRFGSNRQRESGRWQASYIGPDGQRHHAPETFARKGDAEQWLNLKEGEIARREWINPERAKVKLKDYAATWLKQRAGLRPRTVDLYRWLLTKHIMPYLGNVRMGDVDTPMVKDWRVKLLANGVSNIMTAKSYRLLRTIFMTAVKEDGMLLRNPCQVRGADAENSKERPVLSVEQIYKLADLVCARPIGQVIKSGEERYRLRFKRVEGNREEHPRVFPTRKSAEAELWRLGHVGETAMIRDDRFRAMVLVAAFASLRWGELIALNRRAVSAAPGVIDVRAAYVELQSGALMLGPPKSKAGIRSVTIPGTVAAELAKHLDTYVGESDDALVFTSPTGRPMRRSGFQRLTGWTYAARAIGMPGLHFHDLRHTGNTMAADTGTSLKNLMARMGHDNEQAALRYQHRSKEADQAIAQGLDRMLQARSEPSAAQSIEGDEALLAKLRALLQQHDGGNGSTVSPSGPT